jgi:hypothetical protein
MSLPAWEASESYSLGDKVRRTDDNRYYQEVVDGGTSGAGPGEPEFSNRLYSTLDTIDDGGVKWKTRVHAGSLCFNRTKVIDCIIEEFTNAAIMAYGDAQDNLTNASGSVISRCRTVRCGVGIYFFGSDSSAHVVEGCDIEACGDGHPAPAAMESSTSRSSDRPGSGVRSL